MKWGIFNYCKSTIAWTIVSGQTDECNSSTQMSSRVGHPGPRHPPLGPAEEPRCGVRGVWTDPTRVFNHLNPPLYNSFMTTRSNTTILT